VYPVKKGDKVIGISICFDIETFELQFVPSKRLFFLGFSRPMTKIIFKKSYVKNDDMIAGYQYSL
jgi:hypothetical protein